MDSHFGYRSCPGCGQTDFEVLFESNLEDSDFRGVVETIYMLWGERCGRHVKCKNCDLIYVNPIENGSNINEAYSQMKSVDAAIIRESRLRAAESQLKLVKKHNDGAHLLDIGCGEGFFLFNASKFGYSTKGVEPSQDAAAYARKEFGLDVEAKPFEELRFAEHHFDVVTLWQVLEHMPYPLMVLKEIHRILKPGGMLVVTTPDIEKIPARILKRRWWCITRLHINQFTTKTLATILKNAGFKNISAVSYKESISLLMLFIPILRYSRLYKPLRNLFSLNSGLGRIMSKIVLTYPSTLDYCTLIGFK
ncbi:MAG TPA: class I SAM-dependent methyltransferase [Dehalococcoidia bacterium]|nr:class I SAM-dependent methyltransferase [Dehalococcoidia bacterium]